MEKEELLGIVKQAFRDEMKSFYIERETHYQDHQFIKEIRIFFSSVRGTATKTFVGIVITAFVGLIVLGFIFWGKKHIGQ